MKDYAGIATQYARDVVDGNILACKWVKLACARHLHDLERAAQGWKYEWNPELTTAEGKTYRPADRVCYFIELLPHIKGDWAARGERIELSPWQIFFVASVFGWIDRETKRRRFRMADLIVPRKNAKSTIAAGIGLYCLCADGEHGAEIYSGATSQDQAYEVFEPAKLMVRRTPELVERFGITVRESNLSIIDSNGKFEPIIGKPGDGASPSCAIVDEYHEHPTEDLFDTMRTGMGARSQPLLLVITTAGTDIGGPCYSHQRDLEQILEGVVEDDQRFGIVYTVDEGDDWTSEDALIKANPNWGVSILPEFLLAQQAAAIRDARKQATFQTKHLDLWVASASPWVPMEAWRKGTDKALKFEDFAGQECWLGVDLANTTDIASVCAVFTRDIDGEEHYFAFWKHYLPQAVTEQPEHKHYQGWVRDGLIIPTSGSMIDQGAIEADILAAAEQVQIKEIAFDPWGAPGIIANLQNEGFEVLTVALQARHLSAPMKWIDGLLKAGRLHHNGDAVAAWAVNNVEVKPDQNDNWFPRKQSRAKKTDPAIALILAVSRAMIGAGQGPSVYEDRGVIVL
jgi:phage terminase large subunit-like protein